jgi:hypothetical protein
MEINQTTSALLALLTEAYDLEWDRKGQGHYVAYINKVKFEVWPRKRGCFIRTLSSNPQIREQWPLFAAETANGKYWKGPGNGTPWPDTIVSDDVALLQEISDEVISWALKNQGILPAQAKKTADEGYFEVTAKTIEFAVKVGNWDYLKSREALGYDSHDSLITLGYSKAAEANPVAPRWREHVVPCVLITERAVQMVESGASYVEVAQMLKENLAVVVITQEEAKILDSKYKVVMPAGWEFGDSVFARLDSVGIAY